MLAFSLHPCAADGAATHQTAGGGQEGPRGAARGDASELFVILTKKYNQSTEQTEHVTDRDTKVGSICTGVGAVLCQ